MQHRRKLLTLLLAPPVAAAATGAQALGAPAAGVPLLTAGALMLTLGAIATLVVANRSLRRELHRRYVEGEREQRTRMQVEQKLQQLREQLERETESKRSELRDVQRRLEAAQSQLAATESRLHRVARIDEVTGAANRRRFEEALDQEIKRSIREQAPMSLLIFELDHFDEYARGRDPARCDDTLVKVARAAENVFRRAGDLVARYGPAQFAVIQPATDAHTAARFGERVRKVVWDLCIPHDASPTAERMTASIGVVTLLPSKLHLASNLVETAEHALTRAREAGRNRVESALLA